MERVTLMARDGVPVAARVYAPERAARGSVVVGGGQLHCLHVLLLVGLEEGRFCVGLALLQRRQTRSKIPAAPWPMPTHMVTMPYFRFLRRSA